MGAGIACDVLLANVVAAEPPQNYYSALSCTSFFNSNGSLAFTAQQETVPYVWNVGDYSDKQPYNAKVCGGLLVRGAAS